MGRVVDKRIDARKAWGVAGIVAAGLLWWQWPEIATTYDQMQKASEESAKQAEYNKQADSKVAARRKRVQEEGPKRVIDRFMASRELSFEDQMDLIEALFQYADKLGPGSLSFNGNGAPLFKGSEAAYLTKAYARTQEETADSGVAATPLPTAPAVSDPVPKPSGWRTVAHFTGRGTKNTPRFTIDSSEWRVRWKVRGDGNFSVWIYGSDGSDQLAANVIGDDADESHFYSAGEYYLNIGASERYDVWVDAR